MNRIVQPLLWKPVVPKAFLITKFLLAAVVARAVGLYLSPAASDRRPFAWARRCMFVGLTPYEGCQTLRRVKPFVNTI
ncbi:hypothetical protein F4803DRAFT_266332 [Xylaria telfairii]|nr:hypothetical protein F4803DRAFT_266332 [Xylaria telfairii]